MSLFLTHGDTAYTTKTELFDEIIHPQRVHWLPETYQKAKTGFTYAPISLLIWSSAQKKFHGLGKTLV
jgi:hypothetical protein